MPILVEDLILSHNFEVEIIPGENTPSEVEPRLLEVSYISPITSGIQDPVEESNSLLPIDIKRAVQNDKFLFDWVLNWHNGISDVRTVRIYLLKSNTSQEFERVWVWKLVDCQPVAWQGPELDALQSSVAYEQITLKYSDLVWE